MFKRLFAKWVLFMNDKTRVILLDISLLFMRVAFAGFMLVGHGWGKLGLLLKGGYDKFPDPLGVGGFLSLFLAVFAEVVCSVLVIIGLGTRLALTQLIATMVVAGFIVHASDPFFAIAAASKEPALLYLWAFSVMILMGPGRFSVDHAIVSKMSKKEKKDA